MDQIKTGKFIAKKRKEKKLTQKKLAEKLFVSEKTVANWEKGKDLPEISLMIPLTEILGVTVNELLAGETILKSQLVEKADDNLLQAMLYRENNKRNFVLSNILCIVAIVCLVPLIVLSGLIKELPLYARIIIIVCSLAVCLTCAITSCLLDNHSCKFICGNCKKEFMISDKKYIMAPHVGFTRKLKCPKCGKVTWCKHKIKE